MSTISNLSKVNLKLLLDSVRNKGGIVTGGECKIGCKYCYLRESKTISPYIPFNIPFISKADFKKAVLIANQYNYSHVSLGDGLDLISSEPFIHPLIYEFIEELELSPFINNILITTSGLYINKDKYDFLRKCKKIHWHISCSSLSEECRKHVVLAENPTRLLDFLSFLHKEIPNSVVTLQLVTYSLEFFIKDTEIIKNNFPKFINHIYIRELAYSKFFSKKSKYLIRHCRNAFKEVLKYAADNNTSIVWNDTNLHEDFNLKSKFSYFRNNFGNFIKLINMALLHCITRNFNSPILCIPDSCFFVLPKAREKIILPKMKKHFLRIKNLTFGGNYKCYGLLTLDDFSCALKKVRLKDYDVIVINGIFLNRDQRDLCRKHISYLKNNFNLPFLIISNSGRVEQG